jgi:hypothetical protein
MRRFLRCCIGTRFYRVVRQYESKRTGYSAVPSPPRKIQCLASNMVAVTECRHGPGVGSRPNVYCWSTHMLEEPLDSYDSMAGIQQT